MCDLFYHMDLKKKDNNDGLQDWKEQTHLVSHLDQVIMSKEDSSVGLMQ